MGATYLVLDETDHMLDMGLEPQIRKIVSQIVSSFIALAAVWSPRLVKLLEDIMDGSQILICMDTEEGSDQITRQLCTDGWPALSIHGDISQAEMDRMWRM
ncbi:DEAD-box ATP-dependent RNA helicase 20-like [Elaeis guineensis]|uniref:DEAD-box ATP-dependent RNA helicase 20-like n=1 Tax=Elaeis guineensis var. tenera TaxID=51953 RepID=UPI003C6D0D83